MTEYVRPVEAYYERTPRDPAYADGLEDAKLWVAGIGQDKDRNKCWQKSERR